jgi:hypothetical protein
MYQTPQPTPPVADSSLYVRTNGQARILRFAVKSNVATYLDIIGLDAHDVDTAYIDYTVPIREGINLIEYPVALAPNLLKIYLEIDSYDPNASVSVVPDSLSYTGKVGKFSIDLPAQVREYVRMSLEFAKRASHEPLDVFYANEDENGDNLVVWEYKDVIKLPNANGIGEFVASTPAATYVDSGNMWISRGHFLGMTVPIRFFTLLHEHAHYALGIASDTSDESIEQRCDMWATYIFASMGFTEKDLQKLIPQALTDTPTNRERVALVESYMQKNRQSRKMGYATPPATGTGTNTTTTSTDPISAIANAVGSVTQSIGNVLGLRQQRLTQESIGKTQEALAQAEIQMSQEDYWKQISNQNTSFADRLLSIEKQRNSFWNSPMGVSVAIGLPLLLVLGLILIFKK